MNPFFWKILTGVLILCCLLLTFSGKVDLSKTYEVTYGRPQSPVHSPPNTIPTSDTVSWTFNLERDRNNYGLSSDHCNTAFPELYHELERAAEHWSSRNLTTETIDLYHENEGGVRILVANEQLRILQTKGLQRGDFRMRIMAVLHQLQRAMQGAVEGDGLFEDAEFTVVVDDFPTLLPNKEATLWTFTRQAGNTAHDQVWLIPDFNFWSSPPSSGSFQDTQAKARTCDGPVVNKIQKAVWRGVAWTNPDVRLALINATQGQPWADVQTIEWADKSNIMALDEFCHYGYLINTEGRSWSSRLTHILNCDSVPVLHSMSWIAHYYHLLEPDENYVLVNRDFSDIGEKVQRYLHDPQAAQDIADKARRTFRERYTTPAATACYWRALLKKWSTVAFRPELYDESSDTAGVSGLRGIAFEEFVLHNSSTDYPFA